MRWKLIIITVLLATALGASASLGLVLAMTGSPPRLGAPDSILLVSLAAPLVACGGASIFVYRHTARKRRLQALLAGIVTLFLVLSLLVVSSMEFGSSHSSNLRSVIQAGSGTPLIC